MEGEQRIVALIHCDVVIHYEALPFKILADPNSEGLLLQDSFGILK